MAWCLGCAMQVAYQVGSGASMMTDLVFWFVLHPFMSSEYFNMNITMGLVHSLNAVCLILDTALNKMSFPTFRVAHFVLWSGVYVIFIWVMFGFGCLRSWPYPFLDLSTPWAPLWYIGLALSHLPCYNIYMQIFTAKTLYLPRLFPRAYVGDDASTCDVASDPGPFSASQMEKMRERWLDAVNTAFEVPEWTKILRNFEDVVELSSRMLGKVAA